MALTYSATAPDHFVRDFDHWANRSEPYVVHLVDEDGDFEAFSDECPADVFRYYNHLVRVGYANGWFE